MFDEADRLRKLNMLLGRRCTPPGGTADALQQTGQTRMPRSLRDRRQAGDGVLSGIVRLGMRHSRCRHIVSTVAAGWRWDRRHRCTHIRWGTARGCAQPWCRV